MSNTIIKLEDIKEFMISSKPNVSLSNQDIQDLLESCGEIIHDYIMLEPLSFSQPHFHDILKQSCFDLLSFQFTNIYIGDMEETLNNIIEHAHHIYFTKMVPIRSYDITFIRKLPNKEKMTQKIECLRNIPQPEQRTTEWYKYRYDLITASNAWKALDSQSSINSLIYEKCMPLNLEKYDGLNTETPFHWGQKYEPLSIMIYETDYNTKIEDFGCLQSQDHPFLGASPDGVNVDSNSDLYGRMLEVKNIVNREITSIPKREYWCQMQIQMSVCKLNECDFLETRFVEYTNEEAFNNDGDTFTHTSTGDKKGIFMYFVKDRKVTYEYPDLYLSKEEFEKWEENMMEKHEDKMWVKNLYWRLDQLSCILVLRNKIWFDAAVKEFSNIWKIIEHERIHGYEHRAPVKRDKKDKVVIECTTDNSGCLINTEKVLNLQEDDNKKTDKNMNNELSAIQSNNNKKTIKKEEEEEEQVNVSPPTFRIRSLSLDESKLSK